MPKYAYMCKCVFPRPQQWFRGTVVCFGFQYNLQTHTFLFCGDHKLSLDSLSEITTPYFPSRTEYGTAYAKGYALKGSVSSKRIASSLKTIAWNFFCEIHLGSRAHLGFYDTYNMLFTLARMCWNACYAPPRRNVFLHWQKKPVNLPSVSAGNRKRFEQFHPPKCWEPSNEAKTHSDFHLRCWLWNQTFTLSLTCAIMLVKLFICHVHNTYSIVTLPKVLYILCQDIW